MAAQHSDWMHEAFRDHGLHGHAATREGEFGLTTDAPRPLVDWLFIVAMLAMAGLAAYCAFAPWIDLRSFEQDGVSNGRGFGWVVLILSLAVGAALLVAPVRRGVVLRIVVATLFVALTLEAATFCLEVFAFQPRNDPLGPGWGLVLSIVTSACGSVVSIWWCARGFRRNVATRGWSVGDQLRPTSSATAPTNARVPLAGAPTATH